VHLGRLVGLSVAIDLGLHRASLTIIDVAHYESRPLVLELKNREHTDGSGRSEELRHR
jgi:hypothetical protein